MRTAPPRKTIREKGICQHVKLTEPKLSKFKQKWQGIFRIVVFRKWPWEKNL